MMGRRYALGGLILLLFSWTGCDLLEGLDDVEMLAGTWSIEAVRVTVDGEQRDVTSRLLENADDSDLTFGSDGTFSVALAGADNRIERSGTYRIDTDSKAITFELQDDTASGRFDYEIRSEGQQVLLASENVAFLAAMLEIDTDDFDVSAIERVELVLQQRA